MSEQSAGVGRRGGNFDLRLLFGRPGLDMLWTDSPARSYENSEKHGKKSDDQFDGGIGGRGRTRVRNGNAGNLRHFCLEAVRGGLVGHKTSL